MHDEQRLLPFDLFADFFDAGKADRKVDSVIGLLAASAERKKCARLFRRPLF